MVIVGGGQEGCRVKWIEAELCDAEFVCRGSSAVILA